MHDLQRWVKNGEATPEDLRAPDENGRPWIIAWLEAKLNTPKANLTKNYEHRPNLLEYGVVLLEKAQAWEMEWENHGVRQSPVAPLQAHLIGVACNLGDILRYTLDAETLTAWKGTPAEIALKKGIHDRVYIDSRDQTLEHDPLPMTVLQAAVRDNNAVLVGWLLEQGVDINTRSPHGETPLFSVMSVAMLKLLLAAGADPMLEDTEGKRAPDAWVRSPQHQTLRTDLLIQELLKKHPESVSDYAAHQAVINHTFKEYPFGVRPSSLYRRAKDQLTVPFERGNQTTTLVKTWAELAMLDRAKEQLDWVMKLGHGSTPMGVDGLTVEDMARLARVKSTPYLISSEKGFRSWEQLEKTYGRYCQLGQSSRNLVAQVFEGLLRDEGQAKLDARMASMGVDTTKKSGMATLMAWAAENQESLVVNSYSPVVSPDSLKRYLSESQPPADTLEAALIFLSRTRNTQSPSEGIEFLLRSPQPITEEEIKQHKTWPEQYLWAIWCKNLYVSRLKEGTLSSAEERALDACLGSANLKLSKLDWLPEQWSRMNRKDALERHLPSQTALPSKGPRF